MSRQAAIASGAKTYKGKNCVHCGGTERYTSNAGCVYCANWMASISRMPGATEPSARSANADARRDAARLGLRTYNRITPCIKCFEAGQPCSTERYTINGGCIACTKRKANATAQAMRADMDKPAAAPVAPRKSDCGHGRALAQMFPDLNGDTLAYANHPFGLGIGKEGREHFGRCVLCAPDKLIMIGNMLNNGVAFDFDAQIAQRIYTICFKPYSSEGYPLATVAMREFNLRHGTKPIKIKRQEVDPFSGLGYDGFKLLDDM